MTITDSAVFVDKLRVYAYHGVLPQEGRVGGYYTVSLRVHINIIRARETDDVAHTANYASLCQTIHRVMAVPSQLLEHVACRLAEAVFEEYTDVDSLDLSIRKDNPPMGEDCDGAGVELSASR